MVECVCYKRWTIKKKSEKNFNKADVNEIKNTKKIKNWPKVCYKPEIKRVQ